VGFKSGRTRAAWVLDHFGLENTHVRVEVKGAFYSKKSVVVHDERKRE